MTNNFLSYIQLTRTKHDGSVEGLISFDGEDSSWISIKTIESIFNFIEKQINDKGIHSNQS